MPNPPSSDSAAKFRTGYLDKALDDLESVLTTAVKDLAEVDYDTLVGTGFSGALVVPALALRTGKRFALVRKPNDDSHHSGSMIGSLGKRWLFVDDFVASGATLQRAHGAVQRGAYDRDHDTTFVGVYSYAYHARRFQLADHYAYYTEEY